MNRTHSAIWVMAALLLFALLAIALLWRDVRGLQAQLATTNDQAALLRLAEVETQADATESRLTALLLAAATGANQIAVEIDSLQQDDLTIAIPIDQQLPIDLELPFSRQITVPLNTTIPIDTTVEIPINLGALGGTSISVPIQTNVPINLDVPVTIDTTIPISTTIPIQLDLPVSIPLSDSPLGDQLDALQSALRQVSDQLLPAAE